MRQSNRANPSRLTFALYAVVRTCTFASAICKAIHRSSEGPYRTSRVKSQHFFTNATILWSLMLIISSIHAQNTKTHRSYCHYNDCTIKATGGHKTRWRINWYTGEGEFLARGTECVTAANISRRCIAYNDSISTFNVNKKIRCKCRTPARAFCSKRKHHCAESRIDDDACTSSISLWHEAPLSGARSSHCFYACMKIYVCEKFTTLSSTIWIIP